MTLSISKLAIGLNKTYNSKSLEDSLNSWNSMFSIYMSDLNIEGYSPRRFNENLGNLFKSSIEDKKFIEDFGKNIKKFIEGIVAIRDGSEKKLDYTEEIDFVAFSKQNEKEENLENYKKKLLNLIHQSLSKINKLV